MRGSIMGVTVQIDEIDIASIQTPEDVPEDDEALPGEVKAVHPSCKGVKYHDDFRKDLGSAAACYEEASEEASSRSNELTGAGEESRSTAFRLVAEKWRGKAAEFAKDEDILRQLDSDPDRKSSVCDDLTEGVKKAEGRLDSSTGPLEALVDESEIVRAEVAKRKVCDNTY